ncbi:hypothetical protein CR513_13304, partial [Mucuna pruriens]
MVIFVIIVDYWVEWVLVDQGSSANVLFWPALKNLEKCPGTLIGFTREQVEIQGVINLETILGTGSARKTVKMRFTMVNDLTSYNVILGQQ